MANASTTSSAHTPGPWIFDQSAHDDTGLLIFGLNRHHEPLDHVLNPETGKREPVYERVAIAELDKVPEMEANARLIAVAPDMLDTLIRLDAHLHRPYWERDPEEAEALEKKLNDVIDAAQGGS